MRRAFALLIAVGSLMFFGCQPGGGIRAKEVAYAELDGGKTLSMDIYQPPAAGTSLRPAVVMFHGGAWREGSRADCKQAGQWLASRGYVACAVSYRLVTPQANHWPDQINDAQRAVRWLRAHAAEYQIDPERIGAFGSSAGGHLSACLGTMDTLDNSDPALAGFSSRVNCVVDHCGPTDLTEDMIGKVPQGAWCNQVIRELLGGKPELARSASPLFQVTPKSAPFLIFHGRKDDIVPFEQSERMVAALKTAGVSVDLIAHNGGHDFGSGEETKNFLTKTETFLKTHLRP